MREYVTTTASGHTMTQLLSDEDAARFGATPVESAADADVAVESKAVTTAPNKARSAANK